MGPPPLPLLEKIPEVTTPQPPIIQEPSNSPSIDEAVQPSFPMAISKALQEVREVPEEEVVETTVALPIIQEQEHEIEPVEPVEVTKETVKTVETVMENTITTKEDIQPQT